MMRYQQINSTFIPKEELALNSDVYIEDNSVLLNENEQLTLKLKEYENKIKDLEKKIKFKTEEMHSYNNLIVSLEEEIRELRGTENKIDLNEVENLNIDLFKVQEENTKLKEEVAMQKEHAQLLYILILILAIL